MCESSDRLQGVAAASAAYLVNMLPEYAALNGSELFERFKDHFAAALTALIDGASGWGVPVPSDN